MTEEEIINKEPAIRFNFKKNFKGEVGYEYTLRAETVEELKLLNNDMKLFAEEQVKQNDR